MLPATVLVGFFVFLPLGDSIAMSFTDFTLRRAGAERSWIGLENYRYFFGGERLWQAMRVTFVFVGGVVSTLTVTGIIIAVLLNQDLPGRRLMRSVSLLPWVTPTVISAILWMWIYQPQYGVLNYLLLRVGLIDSPVAWLANMRLALPSVMVTAFWRQFPFMFIVLLAGLQGIPNELYESAKIDGAGFLRQFWSITLPMLRNVLRVVMLMSIIANFRQFPLIWTMTGGGPVRQTTTLAILSYRHSFVRLELAEGAAVATVWLVIVLALSLLFMSLFRSREYQ